MTATQGPMNPVAHIIRTRPAWRRSWCDVYSLTICRAVSLAAGGGTNPASGTIPTPKNSRNNGPHQAQAS